VRCSSCQHDSGPTAKFCAECGARLACSCAGCGAELRAGAKFCHECGLPAPGTAPAPHPPAAHTPPHLAERILSTRAALEGERKQVTVLFADVKGSMEIAEQLDPEDWHGIMERFVNLLTDGVHRFEGTVNQFTGDGIMALFGAPLAHEDHAQRACWAALHLRDELRRYGDELRMGRGLNFSVRLGMNSGEVVVGRIGDDLRMDYTAQGHTVGLAQRMEQLAEAGRVYLTEHTAKLVTGYFRLRDLGRLSIKGTAEPLGVYELESSGALATRLDASRARGFTRFVGRAAETTMLETALERAVAGEAQIVGVVGEPGVGKSRLCVELVQRCRARGVPVHEAHCLSHGRALPFLPILELFRSYFDIEERDDPAAARRKIAGTLVLLDERFGEVLPLVFDFLGVPDPERPLPHLDPDARQRQLIGFVSELGRARSAREPAVILIDDLHWIDPASDAILARVLDGIGGTRTLVLLNFRPEYQAEWMRRADYQQVALRPLAPEAITELVTSLLGDDRSLVSIRGRITARAGGNPFFAEELVQSLVETGALAGARGGYRWTGSAEDTAIPATVHGLLAARIDGLPEAAKGVLQTAAVIGREFTEPVLRRVEDDLVAAELAGTLATLTRAELILEQALYPEAVYAFKHPLTHEVAYRGQLAERRRRVHARVAEALAGLGAGSLDERSALVAHHWEEAGDALQAIRWHARAGEWLGLREPVEAMRHWQAIRRLRSDIPESPETLELGARACLWALNLQWRVGLSEDEVARAFAEGRELAERGGDLGARARLLDTYGLAISIVGARYREGVAHVEEALAFAERTGDLGYRVVLYQRLTYLHFIMGNPAAALRACERGLALTGGDLHVGREWVGFSPHLVMTANIGSNLMLNGRLAEARALIERTQRVAEEHGHLEVVALTCGFGVDVVLRLGDTGAAVRLGTRAFELGERIASPFFRVNGSATLANALVEAGEWNQAIAAAEGGLEIVRRQNRIVFMEIFLLGMLARAHLGARDPDRARAAAREVLALCRDFPDPRYARLIASTFAAHVLLRTDGASDEAVAALAQAEALAAAIPDRAYEARLRRERAEVARLRGDDGERRRLLVEAEELFTAMGATAEAERTRELGALE
jgi:class 3 adenylate cyclase/tetratricopeptide (TPR) repeat protein